MKIERLLQVVAVALGTLVAASSPAQDQPALGDVARQQKPGPKAKINITDENISQPATLNVAAGKTAASSPAQADSAQAAPEMTKSDSSPAATDNVATATADLPDNAVTKNETPEHAAARQKVQELQSYQAKLNLQIDSLQKRLPTETYGPARQTLMGMLQDDQQDLEATNKDLAAAQRALDDLDQASNR